MDGFVDFIRLGASAKVIFPKRQISFPTTRSDRLESGCTLRRTSMNPSAGQEARLNHPMPNLHDATLNAVNFDWSRGVVSLAFKVDGGVFIIEATDVTELKCRSEEHTSELQSP